MLLKQKKYESSIWIAYDISKIFNCSIEDIFLLKKVKENQEQIEGGESLDGIKTN